MKRKKIIQIIWIAVIVIVSITMILGTVGPGLFR